MVHECTIILYYNTIYVYIIPPSQLRSVYVSNHKQFARMVLQYCCQTATYKTGSYNNAVKIINTESLMSYYASVW